MWVDIPQVVHQADLKESGGFGIGVPAEFLETTVPVAILP